MSSHIHVFLRVVWENTFFNLALAVYLIAVLCYLAHLLGKSSSVVLLLTCYACHF